MRILGIILIGLQLLAYISGNFEISSMSVGDAIGHFLGYNLMGIIGIILLIRSSNQEAKKRKAHKEENKSNNI